VQAVCIPLITQAADLNNLQVFSQIMVLLGMVISSPLVGIYYDHSGWFKVFIYHSHHRRKSIRACCACTQAVVISVIVMAIGGILEVQFA
jgi:hypothetical protein